MPGLGGGGVKMIASGVDHTVALAKDGKAAYAWGCGEHEDDVLYIKCSEQIHKRGLELAELPNSTFPSAHHFMIHGKNMSALPKDVEVVHEEEDDKTASKVASSAAVAPTSAATAAKAPPQ